MKIFGAVILAVCLSAGAAQAKMMHMAACGDGMTKMNCMCKAGHGAMHSMCKKGMWCHTWTGACTK
jgi:hypothetical protein